MNLVLVIEPRLSDVNGSEGYPDQSHRRATVLQNKFMLGIMKGVRAHSGSQLAAYMVSLLQTRQSAYAGFCSTEKALIVDEHQSCIMEQWKKMT